MCHEKNTMSWDEIDLLYCGILCYVFTYLRSLGMHPTLLVFFKIFLERCPFLGPLIPMFQASGDHSSGFKVRVGSLIRTWHL